MKLDGKKILMEKVGCYNGFFPGGITYLKTVEYKFDDEEKAKLFYYGVKANEDLYKQIMKNV